ncbi:glycosyltransferase family 2 protein [Mycobacterium sp. WMMD1722]|uniref:glycosyltransferase family 2 protein n=1 Tax=Mycobacterium sp. WMMD1722 TaxID=3404117 RepID=UPI003BF57369
MSSTDALRPAGPVPTLHPVLPDDGAPGWDGATWIGEIDQRGLDGDRARLAGADGYRRARLLIWNADRPRGSVEVGIERGEIDLAAVREAAGGLADPAPLDRHAVRPPISIVICTRDRPDQLRTVLGSLGGLDYPEFEVLIVDNNPASGLTRPVVEAYRGRSVRVVDAVGQGLSVARNVGLRDARHDIVAFTDDDVVIDRRWLRNLAHGFARDERVACVCGMVPTSELVTPAQSYFDRRVGWAQRWDPAVYDLRTPSGGGLFPLEVSEFGTGANFAVRRTVVTELGGFDEALGAGAPTGSGEDVDIFLRIMVAGHLLVREPAAVVWHSHRRTVEGLRTQMHNYGIGLSAWITKLLVSPRTFTLVVSRLVIGLRHLGRVTEVRDDASADAAPGLRSLKRAEMSGVILGPWSLVRGRLSGRRAAPLRPRPVLLRHFDVRHGRMWGESGPAGTSGRLALSGLLAGAVAALGTVQALPPGLRALIIAAFVLTGPGCLAVSFFAQLPRSARLALIPTAGLAVCVLAVTGLLMIGVYDPPAVLTGLALATVVGALSRCAVLARRERTTA